MLLAGSHDNADCVSTECTRTIVNAAYSFIRVEAVVVDSNVPSAAGFVPLALWYSAARNDYALTNSTQFPPDTKGEYMYLGQEGWCYSTPPSGAYQWPSTQLSLWFSAARGDYQTCGSPGCLSDTAASKYTFIGNLCFAFNGTGPAHLPCDYGVPSIARGDPAFYDNNYWRGRICKAIVFNVCTYCASREFARFATCCDCFIAGTM